jgi:hypothetical protein
MKRSIVAILLALVVSGCGTTAGYKKVMESWLHNSEYSLIQSWGPPTSVYESGGLKYLTYNKTRSGYVPGTSPNYQTQVYGNTAYTQSYGGSSGYAWKKSCKTTFTLRDDVITAYRFQGSDCKN